MKVSVRDAASLRALSPVNVIGYLRAHGWVRYSELQGRFSVWKHPQHPDAEVVIPASRDARDFPLQLAEALQELEDVEQRPQLDILKDLNQSGFDVLRLASIGPNTTDGTVCVYDGVQLVERARDMLLAAACAAVSPRRVFHSRKPVQALDYMSNARLGQTERGSYVLTLLSPVAPQLHAYSDTHLFPDDPFERHVVKTLAVSVNATLVAAEEVASSAAPSFDTFVEKVPQGVSANLCEAVAGLFKTTEAQTVELSVSWALNRPLPNAIPARTRITEDFVPIIQEAARYFRFSDVLEEYEVRGPVIKLERGGGDPVGRATIYAMVEGGLRKVTVELSDVDYHTAVAAHDNGLPVRLIGNVKKEGRSYKVAQYSGFGPTDYDEEPR